MSCKVYFHVERPALQYSAEFNMSSKQEKLNDLFQLNKNLLTFVENYQLSVYFSVQYMV